MLGFFAISQKTFPEDQIHKSSVDVLFSAPANHWAIGDNCTDPIIVGVPAATPYSDASQTTCGRGNTYDATCLGSYDGAEDIIYRLDVTVSGLLDITMDPKGTYWTGILFADDCPDISICLDYQTGSSGTRTLTGIAVTSGNSYYIMVDTRPSSNCIPDFDLTITFTSCLPPTAQTEANITSSSADLDWTTGGAATWDIEWGISGFVPGSGTTISGITGKPYNLSGLSGNTTYDWYVRDDCGGDQSAWIGPSTFSTKCDAFTAVFTEDFDGVTAPAVPDCWSTIVNTTSPSAYVKTSTSGSPHSTPNHVDLYNDNNGSGTFLLISPQLSDLTSQENQIRFFAKDGGGLAYMKVGTMSDPANAATFTQFGGSINTGTNYAEYTVVFDASYTGTDEYIAFKLGSNSWSHVYIDDFVYEATFCPPPTAQTEANITSTSADLDWTTGGAATWDIEWGTGGFSRGSGTTISGISSKPYNLSGLSGNTTYDWYVRDDCGSGVGSAWTGPHTFTTICGNMTLPWSEGFETMPSVGYGIVPDCMAEDGDWATYDEPRNYNRDARTGTNYVYTYANANDWLFTPAFDLTAGTSYDFSFWYVTDGSTGWTTVEAKYGTGQTAGDMTTAIGTPVSGPTNTTYVEYRGSFTPTTSDIYYMGIHVVATNVPQYITFDDLFTELTPTCSAPYSQTEENITSTSADLGWTENGTTTWDIEWGASPYTFTGNPTITGVSNPYLLSGLTANTEYVWKVRADCGGGDYSLWVGPAAFTTMCASLAPPYYENFDGVTTPEFPHCMTVEDVNADDTKWETVDENALSEPNIARLEYDYSGSDDWFFTQGLALTAGISYEVSFYYAVEDYDYPEKLAVDWGNAANAAAMSGSPIFDNDAIENEDFLEGNGTITPATTGTYYVGFHSYSDDGYYLYVDDVKVLEMVTTATWNGSVDNEWNAAANWSGGLPASITDVIIPAGISNYPTISHETGSIGSLLIESDETGDGSILGNQFLSVNGTTTVQRYFEGYGGGSNGWHNISSPVDNMSIAGSDFDFIHPSDDDLYQWDEPSNTWENYKQGHFANFVNGKGYLCALKLNGTKNFVGTLNGSDYYWINLSLTPDEGNGWHLLGNPYASALEWNNGDWELTNVTLTAKIWNESAGNYTDIVANEIIPSTNGFFVEVTNGSNRVKVDQHARVHDLTDNYKISTASKNPETLVLTISNNENAYYDICKVGFIKEATQAWDYKFDSHKLFGEASAPQLWTVNNGDIFSQNYLPHSTEEFFVPLHFRAGLNSTYHIRADGLKSFYESIDIYLEDMFNNKIINLRDQHLYSFAATTNDNEERFILHFFGITSLGESPEIDGVQIYSSKKTVYISFEQIPQEVSHIEVFNILGQQVYNSKLAPTTLSSIHLNEKPGIYIVRLRNGSRIKTQKVSLH